jgi:hypothetical protein
MGFTPSWWTQLLGDLNGVRICCWTHGLGNANEGHIVLVDTAARRPEWGSHRLGGHSALGT